MIIPLNKYEEIELRDIHSVSGKGDCSTIIIRLEMNCCYGNASSHNIYAKYHNEVRNQLMTIFCYLLSKLIVCMLLQHR